MAKTFSTPEQCPTLEVLADLDTVLDRHERFKPITAFGLKIDVLFKFDDGDGPALSHQGGHPDAFIKLGNAEMRARGLGDVTIYIDGGKYQDMTSRQRHGTLAHELYHIHIHTHKETRLGDDDQEIIVDAPDLDDYGRPVVELVPDDIRITGFREVAEWYGEDSGEVRSYRAMSRMLEQALMPFMGGDDDEPDFTKPGPRVVGTIDADGNLICPRCGCGDLGPVDGGDPMCNGCNVVVAYPDAPLDLPAGTTLSVNGRPLRSQGELDAVIGATVERRKAGAGR